MVAGGLLAASPVKLARVGFVAQGTRLRQAVRGRPPAAGRSSRSARDAQLARRRIRGLGLDPAQKAGRLSGGQRAQLALTLALAKRPELLYLDEPICQP